MKILMKKDIRTLSLCFFGLMLACGKSSPSEESTQLAPEHSYGSEMFGVQENERLASIAAEQPKRQEAQQHQEASLMKKLRRQGGKMVRLESHCTFGYHVVAVGPDGKTAFDKWIDKNRFNDMVLLPGSKFIFCAQLNECPKQSFFTVPKGTVAEPIRVFTPCE
ncbi:MAG: hypothetical protein IPJ88_10645 [Myxococcales bacterium]|nr:MAG: hypothetical protein IPJ88_10645 [Myxococcales bacterium]